MSDASPFQQTINLVNGLADKARPVMVDVDSLASALGQASDVLKDLVDLSTGLDDAVSAMSDVTELCDSLTEVPGLGQILTVVSEAIGAAEAAVKTAQGPVNDMVKDVVKPAQTWVAGARKGVTDLQAALHGVADDVPVFTNTLAILDALLQVVEALASALGGTDVGQRLDDLQGRYDALRALVSKDVDALSADVERLLQPIHALVSGLAPLMAQADAIRKAAQGVARVGDILGPIESAFHAVEEAFAPVKWALDAVSCIFDEVVTPAINAVLDATGLSGLVSGLKDELLGALNLGALVQELGSSLTTDNLSALKSLCDGDVATLVAQVPGGWGALQSTLGRYGMNQDAARDAAVQELASAIEGAPPGDGSGPLQRWPLPPEIREPAPAAARAISCWAVQLASAGAAVGVLATPVTRIGACDTAGPTALRPAAVLGTPDPVTSFGLAIDDCVTRLQDIPRLADGLKQKVACLPRTLVLPDGVAARLDEVSAALAVASDLLGLVKDLPLPDVDKLTPLSTALAQHAQDCLAACTEVKALGDALGPVAAAALAAAASAPDSRTLQSAAGRLHGWKSGAQSLAKALEVGHASPKAGAAQATLDACASRLSQRLDALGPTLASIRQAADQQAAQFAALDAALVAYAQSVQSVATIGQHVSDHGGPQAWEVAHLLHLIDSVINPVAMLFKAMNCASPQPDAQGAVSGIKTVALASAAKSNQRLQVILDGALTAALPLKDLRAAIASASAGLSAQALAALPSVAADLAATLKTLEASLANTCSFTTTGARATVVGNQFVDGDDAAQAVALTKTLAA